MLLFYFKTPGLLFSEYTFICAFLRISFVQCVWNQNRKRCVSKYRPKDLMIWLQFRVEEGFISEERKIAMTALPVLFEDHTREKNTFAPCKRWTNVKFIQFSVKRCCNVCKEWTKWVSVVKHSHVKLTFGGYSIFRLLSVFIFPSSVWRRRLLLCIERIRILVLKRNGCWLRFCGSHSNMFTPDWRPTNEQPLDKLLNLFRSILLLH